MSNEKKPMTLPADNPIQRPEADVLDRTKVAKYFARQVLEFDASEGMAVGVFGPWGSGKTSFVNLARTEFESKGILVLDFNPWMFSGAEQLVERFFGELSTEMRLRNLAPVSNAFEDYGDALGGKVGLALKIVGKLLRIRDPVGKALENYGGALTGKVGAWLKTVGRFLRRRQGGLAGQRKKVEDALRKRDKPIIVVLDDIDRLSVSEIRDIFKLVRLTASFPNLIYIVVCDRLQVEQALDEKEKGLSGGVYLDKILQLPFDLPEVPRHKLREQTLAAIERVLDDIENPGPLDRQVWSDVYRQIIRPLIRNMRDVRRYAAAIRGTVIGLDGQVAHADVLGLEAVRVFLPDIFRRLPGAIEALTVTSTSRSMERDLDSQQIVRQISSSTHTDPWLKEQIDALIQAGKTHQEKEVVRTMLRHLFPAGWRQHQETHTNDDEQAGQLLPERRVAHEDILRLYLERVGDSDLLAFYDAERAFAHMTDRHGLDEFIRSLDPALWRDVVEHLESFEDRFRPEHVEPGIVVLLNLLPDMPEPSLGLGLPLDDPIIAAERVIYRLLRPLNDAEAVVSSVRRILSQVTSLSSKVALVLLVGYRKGIGEKLVSETAAAEFEKALCKEIRSASVDDLAGEYNLKRVFHARTVIDPSEDPFDIDDSPKLTFAILRSVRGETRSIIPAGDPIRGLDWVFLKSLYGGEETLKARIENLNTQFEDLKPWIESLPMPLNDAESLLDLACRYRDGLPPERRPRQAS